MSFAQKLGFAIQQAAKAHESEQQICKALCLSPHELQKLYRGRLFLTGEDLDKVAELCGVPSEILVNANLADENREMILDLIDAYIDAKEALTVRTLSD